MLCLYFKLRMSSSKCKSSGDAAGTSVLFRVLYRKIKAVFSLSCLFFTWYLCEKYYTPTTVRYYIAEYISLAPGLTLLDLGTN